MLERSDEHNGTFCSEAVHNKILPFGVVTIQGDNFKGKTRRDFCCIYIPNHLLFSSQHFPVIKRATKLAAMEDSIWARTATAGEGYLVGLVMRWSTRLFAFNNSFYFPFSRMGTLFNLYMAKKIFLLLWVLVYFILFFREWILHMLGKCWTWTTSLPWLHSYPGLHPYPFIRFYRLLTEKVLVFIFTYSFLIYQCSGSAFSHLLMYYHLSQRWSNPNEETGCSSLSHSCRCTHLLHSAHSLFIKLAFDSTV